MIYLQAFIYLIVCKYVDLHFVSLFNKIEMYVCFQFLPYNCEVHTSKNQLRFNGITSANKVKEQWISGV